LSELDVVGIGGRLFADKTRLRADEREVRLAPLPGGLLRKGKTNRLIQGRQTITPAMGSDICRKRQVV
jgi:hypothetical protein